MSDTGSKGKGKRKASDELPTPSKKRVFTKKSRVEYVLPCLGIKLTTAAFEYSVDVMVSFLAP